MASMRKSVAPFGAGALGVLACLAAAACSLTSGPDERPSSARVRVEGTTPHALKLIMSTEFHEQLNLTSNETYAVLERSDTSLVTLPVDRTVSLGTTGSIYVELRNDLVPTASVRMRVELDNGEGYDRSATLSDKAALVYYWIWRDFTIR